jgi:hypothetical protein
MVSGDSSKNLFILVVNISLALHFASAALHRCHHGNHHIFQSVPIQFSQAD